jgi:hypothetical protein
LLKGGVQLSISHEWNNYLAVVFCALALDSALALPTRPARLGYVGGGAGRYHCMNAGDA